MKNELITEGLESIDRIKLLMGYNLKKTLTENKEILLEQSTPTIYLYDDNTKRWKFSWKERYNNPEYPLKSAEGCPFYKEVDGFKKCAENVILIKDAIAKYKLQNVDYSRIGKSLSQSNLPTNIPTNIIPYPQQVYPSPIDNPQYTNPENPMFKKWKEAFQKEHPDYVFDPLPPLKPKAEIPWWYNLISIPMTIQSKYYNENRDRFNSGGNRFVKLPPVGQGKIDKEQQRIISLRTNKWGEYVPFGFHPDEYHEYLEKVMETNAFYDKKEKELESEKTEKPKDDKTFGDLTNYQKSDVLGGGAWGTNIKNQNIMNVEANFNKSRRETLDALYKAYYHPSHPMGITRTQLISYQKSGKVLTTQMQHEIDSIKTYYKDFKPYTECTNCIPNSTATKNGGNPNIIYRAQSPEMLQRIEDTEGKYYAAKLFLDIVYGYDPAAIKEINKSFMSKMWEDYAMVAELAIWISIDVLTDGWAASIAEGRQAWLVSKVAGSLGIATDAQKIAKIVTFAGKVGLPIGAGIANIISNRRLTEDAVMLFLIAMLPYVHDVVGLLKKPSAELVEGLITKIGKYDLKNENDLRKFVRSLTSEELDLYRDIISMSKADMVKGVEKAKNLIGDKSYDYFMKAYDEGLGKVIELKPKIWYNTIGKFGLRIVGDLSFMEVVKKIVELFGWTKKDIEQKKLAKSLEEYRREHPSPEEFFSYIMLICSLISENPNTELSKLLKDAQTKTDEYMSKNPADKIKTMENLFSNAAFGEMFDMIIQQETNNK
jgi:hypothetical protein